MEEERATAADGVVDLVYKWELLAASDISYGSFCRAIPQAIES
jgi:hypothetical protein